MAGALKAIQAAARGGARSVDDVWNALSKGWGAGKGPMGLWGFGAEKPASEGIYMFGGTPAMPKGGLMIADPQRLVFNAHARAAGDPLIAKTELKFDDPERRLENLPLPTGLVNIEVPKKLRGQGHGTEVMGGLMQLQRSLDEPFAIYDVQRKAAPWWEQHIGAHPKTKRGAHTDYEVTPEDFIQAQLRLLGL